MLVTSRSPAEYRAMFGLTDDDLAGASVLDCCAGGASFAAETSGARVIAADPAYALGRAELAARVRGSLPGTDAIIDTHADGFEWTWYGTPARRARMRAAAATRFLDDLDANPGRYVAAGLPRLPFAARSFDLVLCSHLLFTWADHLDEDWHRAALTELVRVARRAVRVYPLVMQGAGDPVPFLDGLLDALTAAGHRFELRPVSYRFQRNARDLLIVSPA